MGRAIVVTITVAVAVAALACGPSVEPTAGPAPAESAGDELIGGTPTTARPEIGFVSLDGLGACTATLIAPDVVLSAAHCVDYASRDVEGRYGWFGVDAADGQKGYTIDRYVALGSELGGRDLALLHLALPVPDVSAQPARVADRAPARGDAVVVYGYGCLERADETGAFEKRSAPATYRESKRLCPGDSGGPVTLGADGPIVSINSGYYVGSGEDIFADPVAHRAAIEAQLAAWGPPPASRRVRLTNTSGGPLWARCDGSAGPGCSGWVFVDAGATADVETYRRRLVLENQGRVRGFALDDLHLTAPADDVTVVADPATPLVPAAAPPAASAAECLGGADASSGAPAPFDGEGEICASRDAWFILEARAGDTLIVEATFSHVSGDLDLGLVDPTGALVAKSDTTTDLERIEYVATADGPHAVRAYGYRGAANHAHLRVTVQAR